jgi:hypothetical protein
LSTELTFHTKPPEYWVKSITTLTISIVLFVVALYRLAVGNVLNVTVGLLILLISIYSATLFVYVLTLSLVIGPSGVKLNTPFYNVTVSWDRIVKIEFLNATSQYVLKIDTPQQVKWKWALLSPIRHQIDYLPLSHFSNLKARSKLMNSLGQYAPHLAESI